MDCIDLFKRAAMALQTDTRYLALDQARKANDKDEELQNLIGPDTFFWNRKKLRKRKKWKTQK